MALFFLASTLAVATSGPALAQAVTESWLRTATTSCGGGVSLEAQGEFEADLLRRLAIVDAGISGEGTFKLNDIEKILGQFEEERKSEIYKDYRSCLLSLMKLAVTPSGVQPDEVVLDVDFAPPTLDVVPFNKRFVLKSDQLVAVGGPQLLITLTRVANDRASVRLTDTDTGNSTGTSFLLGETVTFSGCVFTMYSLDAETGSAAYFTRCKDN